MDKGQFERRFKDEKPVLAICYDFDKTLSPDDMQAQGFIQEIGYDITEFWKACDNLAVQNNMDTILAYMHMMIEKSQGRVLFTKQKLMEYGSKVVLFPGVEEWFERIREYGEARDVTVEHYIISSGLKEMIEGTSVAQRDAFERIYACSFYYDNYGVARWLAQVVNYTNKTQFLFRIQKGVLDVNDDRVNDYFKPDEIRVPFRNMVYIGDSDTDVPCMKLVSANGGHAIGVYDADTKDKKKVYKMMRDGRINYFAPADYRQGSELDFLVKAIIDRTAANELLQSIHYANSRERAEADKKTGEEAKKRLDLIIALDESRSFSKTHSVIAELKEISGWSDDEKNMLFDIATSNCQVKYILGDADVKFFYKKLISSLKSLTPKAQQIKELMQVSGDTDK